MFPHAGEPDHEGKIIEPIFISAEHGDGLPDLYHAIQQRIPKTHVTYFQEKKRKRLERFNEFKQMLMDEFIQTKQEEME